MKRRGERENVCCMRFRFMNSDVFLSFYQQETSQAQAKHWVRIIPSISNCFQQKVNDCHKYFRTISHTSNTPYTHTHTHTHKLKYVCDCLKTYEYEIR